jgi:broad specificity phosphatase PhoE
MNPASAKASAFSTVSVATDHNAITLELAKKESAEHLNQAMQDLYASMRNRPLTAKAYALDDPNAPDVGGTNVKVVHFVRHGQGFHNLLADLAKQDGREWEQYSKSKANPYVMPEILDAPLTDKGRQQALLLRPRIQSFANQPEVVVVSSQCRAIQTGLLAFDHLVDEIPFVAHEDVRECTGVHTCDKRRLKSLQQKEFPMVDFTQIESEEDGLFLDNRRETKCEVGERIYKFLNWMSDRSETHIGVASHSGWLMTVFNGVVECDESLKPWFQTGEMRSVVLEFVRSKTRNEKE